MMTGSYTGGGVNFAAMASKYEIPGEMVSATTVVDNMMMALFFLMLFSIPTIPFFRKCFQTPHIDETKAKVEESGKETKTQAANFWKRTEMSLKDIAACVGTAFALVTISFKLAVLLGLYFQKEMR